MSDIELNNGISSNGSLYCECLETEPIKENGEIFCKKCGGFAHEKENDS